MVRLLTQVHDGDATPNEKTDDGQRRKNDRKRSLRFFNDNNLRINGLYVLPLAILCIPIAITHFNCKNITNNIILVSQVICWVSISN